MIPLFDGMSKFPICPGPHPIPDSLWKPTKGLPYILTVDRSPHNKELKDKNLEAQTGQLVPRD